MKDPLMAAAEGLLIGPPCRDLGGSSSSLTPGAGDATQEAKDGEPGTPSDSLPPTDADPACVEDDDDEDPNDGLGFDPFMYGNGASHRGARAGDGAVSARDAAYPPGGLPHGEHPYDYGYSEATEVLPEGSVECWNCGAVIAWEGEPPTDCLKCGEAL